MMQSASDSDMYCRRISEQDGPVPPVASGESLCAAVLLLTGPSDNHTQSDFEISRQEMVRNLAPFVLESARSLQLNKRELETLNFLLGLHIIRACMEIHSNKFGQLEALEQKYQAFTEWSDICPKPNRTQRADAWPAEWVRIRVAENQRVQQALDGVLAWQVVPGCHKSQGSHPTAQLTRQNRGGAGSADLSSEGTALLAKTNNHLCLSKSCRPDRAEGTAGRRTEQGDRGNLTPSPLPVLYSNFPSKGGRHSR
jgi:hypothetical protein